MPEIGTTLREARMRQRIDISEVEAETKIRAKYLRALEDEEWNLLPGPAYVKSFLRTYADALGLDGRLLVEEYKLRHERLSDIELQPIAPPRVGARRGGRRGGGRGRRRIPGGAIVAVVLLGLIAALYALGRDEGDGNSGTVVPSASDDERAAGAPASTSSARARRKAEARRRASERRRRAAASRTVRLRVVPTGPVYTCLVDARGRRLIDGVILQAGQPSRTYRSSRFRVTLGTGNVRLIINGKARSVPQSADGVGYVITRKDGRRTLPAGRRPNCG